MQKFDLIVIGAGSGLNVAAAASNKNLKVALIEPGPMGGTCLNRGCIPSKILIHSADVAQLIRRSSLYGIDARINSINFTKVIQRASKLVDHESAQIERGIKQDKNTTLFKGTAIFTGKNTLSINNKTISGEKIVIAAGTRVQIPNIPGLDTVPYITSTEALRLKKLPKTMTIIGGGYIAAELADFYRGLGTKTTIVQRSSILIKNEDITIAKAFTKIVAKNHNLLLNHATLSVAKKGGMIITTVKSDKGVIKNIESEQLLIATGRIPNSDILAVEKTGIKTTAAGYIEANEYMETSAKNIWVLGDIAGKYLFKHSANLEADVVINNAIAGSRTKVNYTAMPHAIFSNPQIAGVGERQQDLDARKASYAIGEYKYLKTGMGKALEDSDGFVRIYTDKRTHKILGCHIIGSEASTLIHEVIIAMRHNLTVDQIYDTIHIHPALSEVIERACGAIEW
ncbi:MAG TPA: dihydrolipoyl dehydrogenase [Candidatus Nanoarchaeia archaeon]|nr:dihydrolipoyl dehydrogenase [Candidatus Nanoarchaeia archaeon]